MMSTSVSSWFGWGKKQPEESKVKEEEVQEGIPMDVPVASAYIEEPKGDDAVDSEDTVVEVIQVERGQTPAD